MERRFEVERRCDCETCRIGFVFGHFFMNIPPIAVQESEEYDQEESPRGGTSCRDA